MKEYGRKLLVEAIVRQAAIDYRAARELAAKGNKKAAWKVEELERWFVSEWGDALCYGYGAYILERLQKEKGNIQCKWNKATFCAERKAGKK